MIVVSVVLLSAVDGSASELARMTIDNIGGTATRGDYRARTLRGRSRKALNNALVNGIVQREGKVLNHARQQEHVWNLVAKALTGMNYGARGAKPNEQPIPERIAIARDALNLAIDHIKHMAAWIGRNNRGYSFEALGEDMPGIEAAHAALATADGEKG